MPAGMVVTVPAWGAAVVQFWAANVTGVLAPGTPAAQLGGTDRPPTAEAWPTPASTAGAPPRPPTPPAAAGETAPSRPAATPPMSAAASSGSAVRRPPPPMPIRSDAADAQFPTWMLPRLAMLLLNGFDDEPSMLARFSNMSPSPVDCVGAADAADDAPNSDPIPCSGVEAAATRLAASVSPYEPALVPSRLT